MKRILVVMLMIIGFFGVAQANEIAYFKYSKSTQAIGGIVKDGYLFIYPGSSDTLFNQVESSDKSVIKNMLVKTLCKEKVFRDSVNKNHIKVTYIYINKSQDKSLILKVDHCK